jgi:hypothetical protein
VVCVIDLRLKYHFVPVSLWFFDFSLCIFFSCGFNSVCSNLFYFSP